MNTVVPSAIERVVREAPITQPGIRWPAKSWSARFPHFAVRLAALPSLLDRDTAKKEAGMASKDREAAAWGFLVAMIWGYGSTGYGPWRVEQMFGSISDPATALHRVACVLFEQGPEEAYSILAGESRMSKLGPAFGTKFLYFCRQPESGRNALILDRLVADWLAQNSDIRINPVPWSRRTYARYLERMHEWAERLSVLPEEVERSIFQAQAKVSGGQWSE